MVWSDRQAIENNRDCGNLQYNRSSTTVSIKLPSKLENEVFPQSEFQDRLNVFTLLQK